MFETLIKEFGHLDIVVSNSGIEHFGSLTEVTGADIDAVFAVNVKGQYFVAQQAYKHMADFGRVMLTSSISAVKVSSRVHLGDRVVLGYSDVLTPRAGRS
jgi:tetrahydroxynaphthalene reductase